MAELAINAIKVKNHDKIVDDKIVCKYVGEVLGVVKIPVPWEDQYMVETDSDGNCSEIIYHAYRIYKLDIANTSKELKIDLGEIDSWKLSQITDIEDMDMGIYKPARLKILEEDMKKNPILFKLVCDIHDIDLNDLAIELDNLAAEWERRKLEAKKRVLEIELEELTAKRDNIIINLQQKRQSSTQTGYKYYFTSNQFELYL